MSVSDGTAKPAEPPPNGMLGEWQSASGSPRLVAEPRPK